MCTYAHTVYVLDVFLLPRAAVSSQRLELCVPCHLQSSSDLQGLQSPQWESRDLIKKETQEAMQSRQSARRTPVPWMCFGILKLSFKRSATWSTLSTLLRNWCFFGTQSLAQSLAKMTSGQASIMRISQPPLAIKSLAILLSRTAFTPKS